MIILNNIISNKIIKIIIIITIIDRHAQSLYFLAKPIILSVLRSAAEV